MTQVVDEERHADWPTDDLYHSPLGLFGFQAEGIAEAYLSTRQGGGRLIVWDTGTGKSHMGMRMASLLSEDARAGSGGHDLTLLLCEKGKVVEWLEDFRQYTRLDVLVHHGPKRMAKIEQHGLPDVLITTYETAKADLVKRIKAKRGYSTIEGPLLQMLLGKRVTIIGDEFTKAKNRHSVNYIALEFTLKRLRKAAPTGTRIFGLTATPIERDWEDAFNQCRLIRPDLMPGVGEFEKMFTKGRDQYQRARYQPQYVMDEFVAMCRPIIMRKRKTDPDVVEQFPKKVEESMRVEMTPQQTELYEMVRAFQDDQEEPIPNLWTTLRQIAGHPASLVMTARHGESKIAKMLVEELGAGYLESIPSAKEQVLIEYLDKVVNGQGAKAVVFTFFGQSILPVLAKSLRHKGFKVYENHGGLSTNEMGEVRTAFKNDPNPCVFLTSDAGSRGINLPEATYVIEYESALTYANRTQRLDRIHRIDSDAPSVTCMTLVVDYSVEAGIMEMVVDRNRKTDRLLDDTDAGEHFMSASDRRRALQIGRLSRKRANQ